MLANYLTDTQNLLQNPTATNALYATASLTRFINISRGQCAGEGECIRALGTLACVVGQRNYNFSAINLGVAATTGIQGAIHVRRVSVNIGDGQKWLTPRPWEWFELYHLNNVVPANGEPAVWTQYKQGAATPQAGGSGATGSLYIDPPPDDTYTLSLDCVCFPIALVDDTTVEAIPYLWTDAVPFFAAYYAFLSSQTSARQADAERMYQHYQTFLERARKSSNPSLLRWMYQQSTDPTQMNKIGLKPQQLQGGG